MPPRFQTTDFDGIEVPAYFVTEGASPDLEQWKVEHADWFVAGTWT